MGGCASEAGYKYGATPRKASYKCGVKSQKASYKCGVASYKCGVVLFYKNLQQKNLDKL